MIAFYLAFFVNNPHFMYSYQLIYTDFWQKAVTGPNTSLIKARYWFAGVIAPVVMAGYMAYYMAASNITMLSYMVNAMLFLVGWHYVKQGFGVLVVLSVYKGIFFALWERWALLINAFFVWLAAWTVANESIAIRDYYSVIYITVGTPAWLTKTIWYGMILSSSAVGAVFIHQLISRRCRIAWNGWVGYLSASYLWIYLVREHYLYGLFFPLFHSLQYLPFVFRYKLNQYRTHHAAAAKAVLRSMAMFGIAGLVLGFFFFYQIPYMLNDHFNVYLRDTPELMDLTALGPQIFSFAFILFINVHHYFIDNVIWRKDNTETKRFLFGFQEPASMGSDVTTSPSAVSTR